MKSITIGLLEACEQGYFRCAGCGQIGPHVMPENAGEAHARCEVCGRSALEWHPPVFAGSETQAAPRQPRRSQFTLP